MGSGRPAGRPACRACAHGPAPSWGAWALIGALALWERKRGPPRLLPPRNGGVGAEGPPGPAHAPGALLRRAHPKLQLLTRAVPEGLPQQRARIRHRGLLAPGEAAADPQDPAGQERRGPELPLHPAGARGHQRHDGLQHLPPLPVQRLGRDPVCDGADGVHWVPGAAFRGSYKARPGLPLDLLCHPVSPALFAHSSSGGDGPAGVQHACCRNQQVPASSHQLPERAHRPTLGHHDHLALCGVLGTHLHLHPGDRRLSLGADLRCLLGVPRPPLGTAAVLLERCGPVQERVTGLLPAGSKQRTWGDPEVSGGAPSCPLAFPRTHPFLHSEPREMVAFSRSFTGLFSGLGRAMRPQWTATSFTLGAGKRPSLAAPHPDFSKQSRACCRTVGCFAVLSVPAKGSPLRSLTRLAKELLTILPQMPWGVGSSASVLGQGRAG